jgi:hypothetical protein
MDATFVQWLPSLYLSSAYVVSFHLENKQGLPPQIYIDNVYQNRAETQTRVLSTIPTSILIIPPNELDLEGYSVGFIVKGSSSQPSRNIIRDQHIAPLPYRFLQSIRLQRKSITSSTSKIFTNYQAYDTHFSAYVRGGDDLVGRMFPFIGGKPLSQVVFYGWANGWILPDDLPQNAHISIVFWPQYLQYAGYGLLAATILVILFFPFNRHHKVTYGS